MASQTPKISVPTVPAMTTTLIGRAMAPAASCDRSGDPGLVASTSAQNAVSAPTRRNALKTWRNNKVS